MILKTDHIFPKRSPKKNGMQFRGQIWPKSKTDQPHQPSSFLPTSVIFLWFRNLPGSPALLPSYPLLPRGLLLIIQGLPQVSPSQKALLWQPFIWSTLLSKHFIYTPLSCFTFSLTHLLKSSGLFIFCLSLLSPSKTEAPWMQSLYLYTQHLTQWHRLCS